MVQRGSELEISAGEECLALARVELERLGIGEKDRRSVDHGHQAAVEQRQAREATGLSAEGQVRVVGPLIRASHSAKIEKLPYRGSNVQVGVGRHVHSDLALDVSALQATSAMLARVEANYPFQPEVPEASEARGAVGHFQP